MEWGKKLLGKVKGAIRKWRGSESCLLDTLERDMPYINRPISDAGADEIGMAVYVDYLESAIEQQAPMIAVVSRFGTGKSSLIELLKKKYHGWEKNKNGEYERVYCQVNLWSQLEAGRSKRQNDAGEQIGSEWKENNTLELHRMFLYQLVAALSPKKSSYFSRRTGRNFGMFRICTESPAWDAVVNITVAFFALVALAHNFSEKIIESGLLEETILGRIVIVGYAVCAIVAVLIILKTEIIFSSKSSEGNRQIEENELINLYREHVLQQKNILRNLWTKVVGRKHLVVIIEDLDRTEDGESVYHFLKELRKYYVPDEQLEHIFINRVTFVVNIMPEDLLQKKCSKTSEYVYDKLFDYELHLNRINIDNFDSVLEALIKEKQGELVQLGIQVQEKDNVNNISGMKWIIHGKNLTLRQVKERLNDAILLYESLLKKFDSKYADFEKCAVVAYLRSAFSDEFYQLPDRKLAEMIEWYAGEDGNYSPAEEQQKFIEKFESGEETWSREFISTIYQLIRSHRIDGNFRTYFFNYPKGSHLLTIQEMNVQNLIVYNEELTPELEKQMMDVWMERPEVIEGALEMRVELMNMLPHAVVRSRVLWTVSKQLHPIMLEEMLGAYVYDTDEWDEISCGVVDAVMGFEGGPDMLADALTYNSNESIKEIRQYILEKHTDKVSFFVNLFQVDGLPITEDELQRMESVPLDVVIGIVTPIVEEVAWEVIELVCKRVLEVKDENVQIGAYVFYNALVGVYDSPSIAKELIAYMEMRKCLIEPLESCVYEGVSSGAIEEEIYYYLLNAMPLGEIGTVQLERVQLLGRVGMISVEICQKMKQYHMNVEYLTNMIVLDENLIDLTKEEVLEVFEDEGQQILRNHPAVYSRLRKWVCDRYRDDVVEFVPFFQEPYPLVTEKELRNITDLNVALALYDASRADEDVDGVFVGFCNRQYRVGDEALKIFEYIAGMEEEVIPKVFYALDMRKVRFARLASKKKARVVQLLRMALDLTNLEEIIRFMSFTESLVAELEKEITDELKTAKDNICQIYIDTVERYGKTTPETVRNIVAMPYIRQYGDVLNEALYKRKYYSYYVVSKIKGQKAFIVEYEKLEILWPTYMRMMKTVDRFTVSRPYMYANLDFLKLIQARKAYTGLPEESRMALAKIPQDAECIEEVLLNYSEDFIVEYYCSIVGFASKDAAKKFVEIMKKNQKYAQNEKIYNHVHERLENPALKREYTNSYKRANE